MANNALKLITQKVKDSMKAAYEKELQNYISGASDTAQKRYAAFEQSAKENPNAALQYLASNQMMKPKSLGDYHADDVRLAGTDRAAYARQLRDTGFFDTEENAYGGYAHNVSTNYLQKLLDTATAELGKSVQADKDHDAAMAAWKGENEKAYRQRQLNETSFNNWVAMSKYEGKDFSDPDYDPTDEDMLFLSNLINGTDYKNIVDMQQRMGLDEDSYSDEWDKMVDLWYEQDWSTPSLPAYTGMAEPEAYESMTGALNDRIRTLQGELNRRTLVDNLEAEAAAMPSYAELSVYQDNASDGTTGNAFVDFWNAPRTAYVGKYDDKNYFINNPIGEGQKAGAQEYSMAVQAYLNEGLDQLTAYERGVYNAFVNSGQQDKADEYLSSIKPMLLQRRAEAQDVKTELLATNPWTAVPAAVASVGGDILSGAMAPIQLAGEALGMVDGPYDAIYDINRASATTTGAQMQAIGEADPLKDVKLFDKTPLQNLFAGFKGAATNLGRAALGPGAALALAGGQAVSGSLYENAGRKDMSGMAQAAQALLSGLVEVGTEKIGLDAFFNKGLPGAKEYVRQLVLSEMGEEALAYFGGEAIDYAVSEVFGHKGEYATGEELWRGLGETLLTTAISSGLMSAPGAAQIRSANKEAGKGISTNDSINQVLEIADSMDKKSASYAEAQNVKAAMKGGKKVSLNKLGRLANAMQKELGEEYGKVIGRVADETIVDRMVELGDSKEVAQKNVQAVKKAAQGLALTAQERADLTGSSTAIQVVEELAGEAETSGEMAAKMQMRSMETAAGIRRKQLGLQEAVRGKQVETDVFAAEDENAPVQTVKAKPGTGAVTFLGEASSNQQVTGSGTEAALTSRMRSMTASQRNTVNGIKAIAKATGVNMVLFESTKEGRAAGVQNGSFVRGTNTIYLDINAGISTESGMKGAKESGVLGYAMVRTLSHELTHFIEANSKEGYAALMEQAKREFAAKGKDWDKLVVAKAKLSAAQGEKLTRTGAEAEVLADACEMMLQDTAAIERLAKQNPSLKEKIAGFIRSFVQKIQKALRAIGAGSAEAKALMEMRDGLMQYSEELTRLWGAGLEEAVGKAQSVEPTKWQGPDGEQMEADGETRKYSLRSYEKHQIDNWSQSKAIEVYRGDPQQIIDFVERSLANKTLRKKLYFGKVSKELAEAIYAATGVKTENMNLALHSDEVLKIFSDHGNSSSEDSRGQRAVVAEDFARIIDVVTSPDSISLSARDRFGKPVIQFVKETAGRRTVVTYTSEKHNDLRVQTMYVGAKKRSLATPMDEQASINTPEASSGTAPDDILHQGSDVVNRKSLRDDQTEDASPDGTDVDTSTDSAYQQYSIRTWAESDYVAKREEAIDRLVNTLHVEREKAAKWIDDVNSISAIILDNKARLDYIPTAVEGVSAFKSNPEYGGSIDMSTICAKRRLATGTLDAIQNALGDAVLTKDDFLHIREMMKERGHEVACGLCFVESSRKNLSKYTKQFLDQFNATHPDNQVSMTDFNTVDGLERTRLLNQEAYAEYEKFMNKLAQRKPKLFEKRTEYRHEILQKFKKDTTVGAKNINGGLRLQSFSDFEIVHLIDMMQVITDMASVGLAGQAYTKVPDFAWALGDTGLKINLSLIAKGVDENGDLIFDDVEGMNHEEAKRLRNAYSKNVGTIVVAFTDEQIVAAMKSDFVDFIIPFHRSQWQKSDYKALGLPEGTKDYTMHQNEKEGRKRVKLNYMPNDYWDFSKTGKQNAQKYLDKCAADGRTPKFAKFLQNNGDGTYSMKEDGSTDGYWKLLIDFKMYDNDGVGSPQNPVQPNFNMEEAGRMLDTYNGIHDSFPVAQDVVDDFVKEYRGDRGGVKVSNGRVTIDNIQKSQRLPDDISTREYLADADSSIAETAEQANALDIYKTRIAAYREATQAVEKAKATLAATTDRDESIKARNRLALLQKQQEMAYDQLIAAEGTKHIRELTGKTTQFIQQQLAGKTEEDIANMIAEAESEIASLTEQLSGLKGASREQTEAVKEQIRMLKARATRLRNSATRKLLETRKHYQEMFQRDLARREINAEAAKKANHIKAVVKRLDDRIRHETDYHNVKEDMKPAVRKLVDTFLDGFGNLVFDQKKADRLLTVYRELDKLDSDESSFYSDDVEAMLADLAALAGEDAERRAGGLSLMDNAETKLAIYSQVADIADNIWHMVKMADEVFVNGKTTKFSNLGDSTGNAMLQRTDYKQLYGWPGKVQRAIDDTIRRGNMIPTYFFESLGNDGLQSLFNGVMNGQTKYSQTILDGRMKMQEAKRKYNYAAWGDKKPVTFKTAQGHEISLTTEQMLWVYATAKRERSNDLAATDHLGQGGFRYEGEVKGEKGLAVSDKPHKLGEGDVQRITDMLTAEQRAYADELVEYLSSDMAEVGNAASMEMFGIRKYQEKYYFPFKTASEQRFQRSDAGSTSTTNDSRVKHSSFTHRLTRHANNTLVMGDFSSIIADHINQMATYASFMNPIESMNRVLNYKVEEDDGTLTTIRALLGRKYGDAALRYVQDFMKDINGGAVADNRGMGMINSLVSAFKRGAVAASLSVAVQQPTAYVRAFAYMNPKYFTHLTGERTKDAWDEVMQYSGTAVIKDMGKFDVGLGQTANDWIAEEDNGEFSAWERVKKYWPWGEGASWNEAKKRWDNLLTSLPGYMDQVTWTHIWKAVKAEQRDLHPDMDTQSEAFLRACGRRFDYIINHTQVYDSVLSKSNLMRSKNALNRMATSFMSEPTLTANVLYSAIKGKHSKAQRGKMIAATVASNILAAAAAAAVSAWNDDDDNRKAMEKYADKFTALAMDNLNPLGMLPYLSDVSSMLEGYSVERADASVVEDLIKHSSSFFGSLQKGEGVTWKQVENFAGTLLNLVGVPAKNISRDVRRLKNAVTTDWSAAIPASVGFATLENIPYGMYADTKKAYYKRYVGSVIDGNRQKAYNIKDYMTSSKGTSENAWATGIRDVIKAMVASGSMTPEEATAFLREHAPYKNDKDNINKPKEWAGKQ